MKKAKPTAHERKPPRTLAEIRDTDTPKTDIYELRLYVAGKTARSVAATENLKAICEKHLPGQYTVEVVDLLVNPQLARADQIVAIPTLVRKLPEPVRKVIGDLADVERTLVGLQIRPVSPSAARSGGEPKQSEKR